MSRYIAGRLSQLGITLLGLSVALFWLLHLIPGDPARLYAGPEATKEEISEVRRRLGLDDPVHVQYLRYAGGVVRGDWGTSIRTGRPVVREILVRYPATLNLAFLGLLVTVSFGLPAGVISATKPGSRRDRWAMTLAVIGASIPVFWSGLMLVLLLAVKFPLFPSGGSEGFVFFILPSLALGFNSAAVLARLTRSAMTDVLREDYIRTARAKGLTERRITYRHALRNALLPLVTVLGMEAGTLLSGAVLTETVFSINGLGRYIVQSIGFRDYPVVMGAVLLLVLNFALINLFVDVVYSLIDPRVRFA